MKKPNCNVAIAVLTVLFLNACTTILPGEDPVVVNAQKTYRQATLTFDSFLKMDEQLGRKGPQHSYAEYIRVHAPKWEHDALVMIDVYSQSKTEANRSSLQTLLTTMIQAMNTAQSYIDQQKAKT